MGMRLLRLLSCTAAVVALSACAATGPSGFGGPAPSSGPAPFRASDFAWSSASGKGRIEGLLAFRRGQTRYTCAGAGVVLTPETPWTKRRMSILYTSPVAAALPADEVRARTPSAPNEDYSSFVRRATCDAANRFAFSGLPDGAWFVIASARPAAGAQGPTMAIMKRVETRGGRLVNVTL